MKLEREYKEETQLAGAKGAIRPLPCPGHVSHLTQVLPFISNSPPVVVESRFPQAGRDRRLFHVAHQGKAGRIAVRPVAAPDT